MPEPTAAANAVAGPTAGSAAYPIEPAALSRAVFLRRKNG